MNLISCLNYEELSTKAAALLIQKIKKVIAQKGTCVLAIPGGQSIAGIFTLLKSEKNISWNKVHLFWIDERMVPLTDKDSNYRLAKELFLDELIQKKKISQENIHPFDFKKGIAVYEQELKKYGGVYDICLFGVGEDGHIAALFPHHHSLTDQSPYFLTMKDSPKSPPQRMTTSVSLLRQAETGIVLFCGKVKQQAFEKFKDKSTSIEDCPAKLVCEMKERYVSSDLR